MKIVGKNVHIWYYDKLLHPPAAAGLIRARVVAVVAVNNAAFDGRQRELQAVEILKTVVCP
jgi:hypothetical protein